MIQNLGKLGVNIPGGFALQLMLIGNLSIIISWIKK